MEVKCVSDKTMWTYVIYRHRARGHNRGLRLEDALQKSIVNLTKSYQLFALFRLYDCIRVKERDEASVRHRAAAVQ